MIILFVGKETDPRETAGINLELSEKKDGRLTPLAFTNNIFGKLDQKNRNLAAGSFSFLLFVLFV